MHHDLALLAILWLAYFALHSVLAALGPKQWIAGHRANWMPYYRLAFNIQAVILVLPILWLTLFAETPVVWQWQGGLRWLMDGVALGAVAGLLFSSTGYDMQEFLGLRQIRDKEQRVEDQETLHIGPFHRYVRHPWYSLSLVLIWTRGMDQAMLLSACLITLYFIIGSRLEEQKLLRYHGESYARYRAAVPGLIPLPWRYLTNVEAREIERMVGSKAAD
jgi:protein-S-isoprenylcysteine O-methyltransferase Ste14